MGTPTRPSSSRARRLVERMLGGTGISIDGPHPWDIQVRNERVFTRLFREGSIGLGESYMDGWWDCDRIDEMVTRLLRSGLGDRAEGIWAHALYVIQAKLTNLQSKTRAFMVGKQHYDLGNDLFQRMLDDTMCYSCGYWKEAHTLHGAQVAKLDLIARKLGLQPGMHVLDVGCGWGSFAQYAARHYGCRVTGITISKEQAALARQRCEGLPVEILLKDYRELEGRFDRIVSIGMFEHVGQKNYPTYFAKLKTLLADKGLFLLHTIGTNTSHIGADPWLNKYIFPNGVLPSVSQLVKPTESLFVMEDWQNFGPDYDETLMAWHERFETAWPEISERYNERTYRMFRYYLLICAATFRARATQLWQVVFSHHHDERYDAPR